MTLLQAVILGIVQGITEFFPVSSSGHLVIFQGIFGLREPDIAFDIFLHLGTLLAIFIYFRRDILGLFLKDRKTLFFLALASIPTAVIGFMFKDIAERFFGMPRFVGAMLLVTGAWLILASFKSAKRAKKKLGAVNSVIVGIAQGIAVMPGISRSGATIATGMLSGLEKETAVRFSFLLAIPAIAGAGILKAHKIASAMNGSEAVYFAAGGLVAMLTGLFAIKVLLELIKKDKLYLFGIYSILAGTITVILLRG